VGAFSNCTGLTSINFNATNMGDLTSSYSSSSVFSNAGTNAGGITVTIGANVTKIPAYLFSYSPKITAVNFASGSVCQSIGQSAFYNCTGLTSITIPNSVTTIYQEAFYGCGLTSVTFATGINIETYYSNIFPSGNSSGDNSLMLLYFASSPKEGTYTRPNTSGTWTKQ